MIQVPIGVSARHIHLSQEDLETLFGKGYRLSIYKELNQPGEFAATAVVDLVGPKSTFSHVRVLGPVRERTQIEISKTDSFALGVKAPFRESGDVAGSPGLIVQGPEGKIALKDGVIVAKRHLHVDSEEAERLGLVDGSRIAIRCGDEREVIFGQVLVRTKPGWVLECHIDTDEANAAGIKSGDLGTIIKIPELQDLEPAMASE